MEVGFALLKAQFIPTDVKICQTCAFGRLFLASNVVCLCVYVCVYACAACYRLYL